MQLQLAMASQAMELSDLDSQLFDNGFGPSTIRKELEVGWGMVAMLDGEIGGYVLVRPNRYLHDLTRLATHQDHRRRGIARALFQAARAAFPGPMMLLVRKWNDGARALYTREGFRIVGEKNDSWLMIG